MSFRPEGWENPHAKGTTQYAEKVIAYQEFEAGADAMLKALRKMGKPWTRVEGDKVTQEKLVFIPED